ERRAGALVDVLAAGDQLEDGPPALGERGEPVRDLLAEPLVLGAGRDAALGLPPREVEPHAGAPRLDHLAPGARAAPVDGGIHGVPARAEPRREPAHEPPPEPPAAAGAQVARVHEPAV